MFYTRFVGVPLMLDFNWMEDPHTEAESSPKVHYTPCAALKRRSERPIDSISHQIYRDI